MKHKAISISHPSSTNLKFIKISIEVIVALLILLWIYTGMNKLLAFEDTRFQMGRSPFINHIADILSMAIPIGEIIIAGLLIFKKTRLIGLLASFFLMLVFTGYVYAMLHYSYYIPCSCGGVLAALSWENHLIFNIAYTILALIGIILFIKFYRPFKR